MRTDRASATARFVAVSRGLAPLLPEGLRLVDDPYGAAFGGPAVERWVRRAARFPALRLALLPMLPWAVYMQVRTRVLDDALERFVRGGGRQLVILGAGFDARAQRLGARLGDAAVFEVDHPATQARKREVMPGSSARVRYLAWDFERDPMRDLAARLAAHGHDRAAPTFTLWEGVTMYLTPAALDATLDAVADYSAPGSALAFNYMERGSLERPDLATRIVHGAVRAVGEPFRSGFDPEQVARWVGARGFTVREDRSFEELARGLLPPPWSGVVRAGRRVATVERTAVVEARPKAP